ADKLLLDFKDKPRSFNLIFSARSIENLGFIRGFQEKIGKGFPLIGISLQDRINFHKNFIFYRDFLSDTACLGLLFVGKIDFTWIHKHGWKPLGITHTITKTKDNLISEIDGKPAVRIYQDYLGYDVDKLKKELKYISLLYPLGIYSPSEKNYLLRSITKINDDGTLNTQGEVKENQKVKIMIATKESCLKATKEAIEEIKSLTKRRMNFLLFFESPARVFLLGSEINKELELIKEENLNFVGIMSYGQIFPTNKFLGEIQFHEHSICFLGF
ncbi:MAG: FIST C-terminal domain-containing protein, partial [Candidatus Omnitrophica bacterium]|nr:FIST C-terminal domain-containing protein [Candidatus Omnitrophota bacterium]